MFSSPSKLDKASARRNVLSLRENQRESERIRIIHSGGGQGRTPPPTPCTGRLPCSGVRTKGHPMTAPQCQLNAKPLQGLFTSPSSYCCKVCGGSSSPRTAGGAVVSGQRLHLIRVMPLGLRVSLSLFPPFGFKCKISLQRCAGNYAAFQDDIIFSKGSSHFGDNCRLCLGVISFPFLLQSRRLNSAWQGE